jgi:alkanesulfonate monooxygenase SsuD/methylene tetrahydromethanopterin reductase-like flavin-dependent oxidoreductase (luciferase family)
MSTKCNTKGWRAAGGAIKLDPEKKPGDTRLKIWMFEFLYSPARMADTGGLSREDAARAQFESYWARWLKAEGYGFEGIFFSEHHFGAGSSPSPNLLVAALAPMTTTLRLGVMGTVLPYHQPWRVLEELGMLDHLTGGRLEVGTAAGIPAEMAMIGLTVPEANVRNAEAQEILDRWIADPHAPVNHKGEAYTFDNLTVVPPLRQAPPPRWTTVVSEASARRSARRGTKIATGFTSVEGVKKVFGGYREDADAVGLKVTPESFGLRRAITLDRDGDAARALSNATASGMRQLLDRLHDRVMSTQLPDAPPPPGVAGGAGVSDDDYIAGTPAEVAEQIIEQCRAVGAGHFMAVLEANPSLAAMETAYDLFGQEVLPVLKRAGI